ncbi:hypothetical protein [Streptomyces misionensis]|uniref:hypothetical protein n=1 Tax=Streptomyces misionensis TaxID=67331 RepID=UPI00313454BF
MQRQPAAGSCRYRYEKGEPLEDTSCTPGAISPAVTQATLASTICRKGGYTKGIRPPESVTGPEKRANAASYGYTGRLGDAEYDHLISLELGGDPNDARNLWVEPPDPGHKTGSGANNLKDPVESKLHTAVCSGKTTLKAAQQAIVTDWTTALSRLGLAPADPGARIAVFYAARLPAGQRPSVAAANEEGAPTPWHRPDLDCRG